MDIEEYMDTKETFEVDESRYKTCSSTSSGLIDSDSVNADTSWNEICNLLWLKPNSYVSKCARLHVFYKHHTSNLHIIGIRFKMNTIVLYDLISNELFIDKTKISEVSAKILIKYISQKYLGNFQKSNVI